MLLDSLLELLRNFVLGDALGVKFLVLMTGLTLVEALGIHGRIAAKCESKTENYLEQERFNRSIVSVILAEGLISQMNKLVW